MSTEPDYSEAELEAGRLLFAQTWTFATSVAKISQLTPAERVEVAFVGRSNVGKSSLINALTGRRDLARTSNTPGRTQMLNFFTAENTPVDLVDMPGYGYAQAPKHLVDEWTNLVFSYLRGRATLRRLFLLVDSRHGVKANDLEAMSILDTAAVSYQVVLTKVDKIKAGELEKCMKDAAEKISKRPAAHPVVMQTSSEKNFGVSELRAEILKIANY